MQTETDYENYELSNNIELDENDNEKNDNDNENDKKDESTVDILFDKLQLQFNDSQQILKTLHNNLKILYKEVLKERKELLKKSNKNNKKKKKKII